MADPETILTDKALAPAEDVLPGEPVLYAGDVLTPKALAAAGPVLGKPTPVDPALLVEREHGLVQDPPSGQLWSYSPTDEEAMAADVMRVTDNGSFVSLILRVISVNGMSKRFEELTGEDGLTFGVTDFAGTGCYSFFKDLHRHAPEDFTRLFGQGARLLVDKQWMTANNPAKNNAGLIRLRWVREGLARLLGDRRFHGFQLAHFVQGKVRPALTHFQTHQFQRQFTLAVMIRAANSFGRDALRTEFLEPALAATSGKGLARENAVVEWMLERYTRKDVGAHPAIQTLLARGLGDEQGPLPTRDLGHRGRGVLGLFTLFPFSQPAPFTDLGTFVLQPDERYAGDSTTA